MSGPRFIRIEFERGVTAEDYDKFCEDAMDLAEAAMAKYPADCDNEIMVSGGGEAAPVVKTPRQPEMGGFCGRCGHFAARHDEEGCAFPSEEPCPCRVMQWDGYQWPRPWLPAPEGLRRE